MKVGDEVWFCQGIRANVRTRTKIVGETKTQWIIDQGHYNHAYKKTLKIVGGICNMRIAPITEFNEERTTYEI